MKAQHLVVTIMARDGLSFTTKSITCPADSAAAAELLRDVAAELAASLAWIDSRHPQPQPQEAAA